MVSRTFGAAASLCVKMGFVVVVEVVGRTGVGAEATPPAFSPPAYGIRFAAYFENLAANYLTALYFFE